MNVYQLLVIILKCSAIISFEIINSVYDIHGNTTFSNLPLDFVFIETIVDCARYCLNKECMAASFLAVGKKCYLSGLDCESTVHSSSSSLITVPKRTFIYVSNSKKTWIDAQEHCKSVGGQLATIYTSCENERVKSLTPQTSPVWIDGTDIANEGTWLFSDGSLIQSQVKFDYWGPDQPNNYLGNQHCMAIYYFSAPNVFEWADENCSNLYDFICEI